MLERVFDKLRVRKDLVFGKGAKLFATSAAGVRTEVDMTELAVVGGLTATATEINRAADVSGRLVAAGSALTVTEALHDGKTILLDTAAGSTCTLPTSSGSGAKFRFVISTLATSNSHIIKVANATDVMSGVIITANDTDGSASAWETDASSDTITLNRTTTGSTIKGEWVEVQDIAAGFWAVTGVTASTGTEATPFSATVS